MDISKKQVNSEAQESGIWFDYDDDTRIKIRSTESKIYTRAVQKHTRKLSPAQQKSPGVMKRVTERCIAEALVDDWEGITENGKPLKCTPENIDKIVAIPDVRDFIAAAAQDHANFEQESVEATASAVKSGTGVE